MGPPFEGILSAAASFLSVTLIVIAIFFVSKCRTRWFRFTPITTRRPPTTDPNNPSSPTDQTTSYDPSLHISMSELVKATADFSPAGIIGDGGFGLVYKARLSSGVTVAVKKLSREAFQGFREFKAEMDTLGRLRHENIVKMLGFCSLGEERVLVYEFMEGGSVDQWLYQEEDDGLWVDKREPLSWSRRLRIVVGVAKGLEYLHGLEAPVIHRDIKTSNVLLDGGLEAHISDFGLARMVDRSHSHVSTQVAGTMGYMPPEYKAGVTTATVKADVYSFGVLMVEVGTGRRPCWPVREGGVEMGLVQWVQRKVMRRQEMEMVDSGLGRREEVRLEEVREFFRIALLCAGETGKERPTMSMVVDMLSRIPSENSVRICESQ